ncbi:hypothetical protein ABT160_27040 [Streptomyces sp. NPDC001941]|uniref:hypothetical protein n=1 Tax=Streptomyces sp. NPDC001941 TaxID=3154659 RepID=UPI0033220031
MELAQPLDHVSNLPWASFSHAYGSAEDVPDLLRALAGADEAAADEALSELYGCVLHQGTVYGASAQAVPFLAGIAAAGHRTADVLALLGGMAESEDEYGVEPGSVRAAVAAQLPLLLPLVADAVPEVRRTAVWAASHTGVAGTVLPVLRARWPVEDEPGVRVELLSALVRLDAAAGLGAAAGVLVPAEPAEVRLAAVFAHLDAGAAWTGLLHTTMLALLPADDLRSDLDLGRSEPLADVVEALVERGSEEDREAAFALVDAALRDGRAEVRAEGLWAADRACALSRSAPVRLLEGLRAAAVDERSVVVMASLLGRLGPVAAPVADVLVEVARRDPEHVDDKADQALAALVLVAPAVAVPHLTAGLGRRPRALDAAGGLHAADAAFPFDPALLDAVRERLARPEALTGNEPWHLTALLAGWGTSAAPALPELCAALPHYPSQAARAIASVLTGTRTDGDLAADRARAVAALRAAAGKGSLQAAEAVNALTGDAGPLLGRIEHQLRVDGSDVAEAATALEPLGPRGAALVPALRAAFSGPEEPLSPALDADTAIARALWSLTGRADETVAVLASVFARAAGGAWTRWQVVRAARAAAAVGPEARSLVPHVEAVLDDPQQAPAAVLALLAVADPARLDHAALADAALRSAEWDADAPGACDALEALDTAASGTEWSTDHLRRLAELADGDRRVVRSGLANRIIAEDEVLRSRARALIPSA